MVNIPSLSAMRLLSCLSFNHFDLIFQSVASLSFFHFFLSPFQCFNITRSSYNPFFPFAKMTSLYEGVTNGKKDLARSRLRIGKAENARCFSGTTTSNHTVFDKSISCIFKIPESHECRKKWNCSHHMQRMKKTL